MGTEEGKTDSEVARTMRCDGEPVGPGTRAPRLMSRALQPDKQNGTLSVDTIKASGHGRPHQQVEHKTEGGRLRCYGQLQHRRISR
jgi:hypothetical protein